MLTLLLNLLYYAIKKIQDEQLLVGIGLSGDASMGNARAEHFPKQSMLKFNSCNSCLCRPALTYMNVMGGYIKKTEHVVL